MCTRLAHHKPRFIILFVQNLFPSGKESRTRSLSTHYTSTVHQAKSLISAYENATQLHHDHLLIDFAERRLNALPKQRDRFVSDYL